MINAEQQTLSRIALEHHEMIPVLEKYHLDFCCNGKRTLAEACAAKKISVATVIGELEKTSGSSKPAMPFTEMNSEQLISYILIHHHFYVKQSLPTILNHLEKVVAKHGERYPNMKKVLYLFNLVKEELEPHMQKEELVLFPRIREIAARSQQHIKNSNAPDYIEAPVEVMEHEHDKAGQLCFEIRDLTNHYTPPEDACTTHRVCMEELKAFEEDLHRHIHLENNILFPMAVGMVHAN